MVPVSDSTAAAGDSARTGGVADADERSAVSRTSQVLRQLKRNSASRVGLYVIGLVTLVALVTTIDADLFDYQFAATFWYHPENDPSGSTILLPPVGIENSFGTGTWAHPLGTDHRGRDVLVRLVYGTRIAVQVGLIATGIGMTIGTVVGAVSGYYGGWVDDVLQRFVESLYAIPFLILVIAIMSAFGRELGIAIIGVSITTIPVFTRLIRSQVLSVREMEYVEAAKAAGVRDRHIIFRHIIPNSFAPVLVQSTLQVGVNILIVASLSFLGFGVQPPTPSWGQMLAHSRQYMIVNSWSSLWPGLEVLATVVGFNLLGDGLRDAIDPRSND
ncbi:peptide ABC transporter permease [Haloferax volcanii DS2]|uniref:Peptide ABC transporter permease n=1 Tax=Haloferax volcanii (strain ATCC 29605 / DSM 3757 / JCM 8879 / NBRC 14742 / NCIMB 2012 / VKM B-1768 / DS2) TaxID=309800 RepID=L9VHX4_HALVD|nr:peptide ABC transporter permease [Haloferax volcanii DS2]